MVTMKKGLLATAAILSLTLSQAAFAGSAVDAVERMASESEPTIDRTTTGSVASDAQYDARGVVMPNAEVTLGAGIAASIKSMPFKEGSTFRQGDNLVTFDCGRQEADLRGAKAGLGKAASIYSSKKRLKSRGAAGSQEVKDAAADVAAAKANADGLAQVISLCRIDAPFNGRVVERHAETFEIPAANAPILTVVDDSALELDLIVSSKWLRWVKPGTTFDFAVDELGTSFRAKVARLGAKVDAVSQTIKLTGTFIKRPQNVLAGMSGTAKFAPPPTN
ncbi:efflux RND transporter periplasmic adaptor subunit [Ahrensia sp. R2A130]|uniref:efflux RND transporter periplasmic adaptor subunit n=1 Tax=Ahrensia sp. R2A130 TaxID=744979 RepID=UPI0001E0F809|nr:HlyD family efflux transporter periplasmic adaptor subunit [Ahrensia sp. R2A130]EFL90991.1 membrane-fusion protein [Ahrensia sp. R2A130]